MKNTFRRRATPNYALDTLIALSAIAYITALYVVVAQTMAAAGN